MNVDYYYTYSNRSSSKVSNKGIPERRLKKKKKPTQTLQAGFDQK